MRRDATARTLIGKFDSEHMKKLKTIWLPRGKRVYVWQGLIATELKACDELITITQNNAGGRNNRNHKQNAFLLKEIEENSRWARVGANLYFGWFTLIFLVNLLAAIWLFTYNGVRPPYARLVFLVLIGLNLAGTIVSYFIRNHMHACDRRIRDVMAELKQEHPTEGRYTEFQSPVPHQMVNVLFAFTGMLFFMLLLFWVILAVWPHVFLL
jgi:hypothetical protein